MVFSVKFLDLGGRKEEEIDADSMSQTGNLAVEFYRKVDGRSQLVAAFSKDKFISAIRKDS